MHINPPKFSVLIMAPEMSHQIPATPPNTPTESSEPVATSTIHEIGASTSMLSEKLDIRTKMGPSQPPGGVAHPAYSAQGAPASSQKQLDEAYSYLDQVKAQFVDQPDIYDTFLDNMKDYMDPNTICATDRPVANNALTPTQTAQGASINGAAPQQPDAAKDAESFDLSTMMGPWSTSLPLPQMLAILIKPPELTRQKIELFPPIVVRLLQPENMPNVWAIATLLSNGTDVTDQLGGELIQSPIDGTFCFSRLTIHEQGVYCVRISLYQMDLYTCPKGVAQVGCVDSNDIIIAPRPDFMTISRSIGDVTTAQDTQRVAQPLLYQTLDANACIDDHTGYFPKLKIHAGSSVIIMRGINYPKYMVLVPVSNFKLGTATSEHGLYNFGDGLFRDEDGVWFDDGEIERAESLDESIWLGEDGEMYRKRTDGVFSGLFVGLERRVAYNGDNGVMYIAHNVFIN